MVDNGYGTPKDMADMVPDKYHVKNAVLYLGENEVARLLDPHFPFQTLVNKLNAFGTTGSICERHWCRDNNGTYCMKPETDISRGCFDHWDEAKIAQFQKNQRENRKRIIKENHNGKRN